MRSDGWSGPEAKASLCAVKSLPLTLSVTGSEWGGLTWGVIGSGLCIKDHKRMGHRGGRSNMVLVNFSNINHVLRQCTGPLSIPSLFAHSLF